MKTISLFSIPFFLLMSLTSFSQKKYELGKVTLEELNEKVHPVDSSAVAAILFKKGEVNFEYGENSGFNMVMVVKTKIKIYKKEGYNWANFGRQYFVGGNSKESVYYSKTLTYNIVDGKIEKTKLKNDGEFDEKVNKDWNIKKISMPNVREGSIIEFEYTLKAPSIGTIDEWDFQSSIPVEYSEFITYIPEYFDYKPILRGFITPKIEKDSKQRTINYVYTEKNVPGAVTPMPKRVNAYMEFIENRVTYSAADLPAMKDESYVNNIRNYICTVFHELSMIQYPNEPIKNFSTDWATLTQTIYESEDFGGELKKTGYFEKDIDMVLKDLSTQKDRVLAVFNFVKSKVKWNEYNSYYCRDGVKKAYKDGVGNIAEINLMLVAMLRYANIEANPILISTRSNGIPFFANRSGYNYVIAGVEIENDVILLDASSKNSLPNILPIRDLNWLGRIIRKNGSSAEVDIMPKMISNEVTNIMATISNDGTIEGKIREQHYDYNAFAFRELYASLAKESYLESLEKKRNNIEINDYDVNGKQELNEPITENYSFKSTNNVEVIGDKLYFSPLLFFATKENPFKQDKREYPVDFIYPNQDRYIINLTIPNGYVVESLPKSVTIPMSNNYINIKYLVSNSDNKIQMMYTHETNTSIIGADDYEELKAVYNEIVKKENEKVVLKKI